jgi:hypothetical protein
MRESVTRLVSKGQMPPEASASEEAVDELYAFINAIQPPVSDDEAKALFNVYPATEETCYGIAWTLLHLIETCPNVCSIVNAVPEGNPWVQQMKERCERSRKEA